MSTLKVDTLQTTSGTELTLAPGTEFIEPNYEIDNWKLNSGFSSNEATVTGWVRANNTTSAYIGTGMSESSGIFTFPRTGLYKITVNLTMFSTNTDSSFGVTINGSTDAFSSVNEILSYVYAGESSSTDIYQAVSDSLLFNCTNTSLRKIKLVSVSFATSSQILGASGYNYSSIMFERKGPAQ